MEILKKIDMFLCEKSEQTEYQKFFKKKLEKYGVSSPDELNDTEKKAFFDEIDREWDEDTGKEIKKKKVDESITDVIEIDKGSFKKIGSDNDERITTIINILKPFGAIKAAGADNWFIINNKIEKALKVLKDEGIKAHRLK